MLEREIDLINNIIAECILHGGDCGGPYLSNHTHCIDAINRWLKEVDVDNEYTIIDSRLQVRNCTVPDIPQIKRKEDI